MMIVNDACSTNIINEASRSVNEAFRNIIDDSRRSKLWHNFCNHHDDCNMFLVQATEYIIEYATLQYEIVCK